MISMRYRSCCLYCGKAFSLASSFDRHLHSTHPEYAAGFYRGFSGLNESPSSTLPLPIDQFEEEFQFSLESEINSLEALRDSDLESLASEDGDTSDSPG